MTLSLFFSTSVFAKVYTCTYKGYKDSKRTFSITINNGKAMVKPETLEAREYKILKDTDIGLVLVEAFTNFFSKTNSRHIGLMAIVIDKESKKFSFGSILYDRKGADPDFGTCKF